MTGSGFNMTFGRKLTVYLADGAPSGIRHVEIANWSGQAIACPRSRLNELGTWEEATRPGVYFLLEKQTGETGNRAYIGESENVVKRLSQHDREKDFWNEVVIFTSKDANLTKSHIKYLEARLTEISRTADRYVVENANTPSESLLPRSDRDAMEEFIQNLGLVIGTLGHRVLEPIKVAPSGKSAFARPLISSVVFQFKIKNLSASGQQTDDGFVLFANSQVSSKPSSSMPPRVRTIYDLWCQEGVLVKEDDHLRLTRDSILSSSSYAASLVAGTSRSGPQSWSDNHGRTLKIIEEQMLNEVST